MNNIADVVEIRDIWGTELKATVKLQLGPWVTKGFDDFYALVGFAAFHQR